MGIALTISAMPKATTIVKLQTTIQPILITPGPPVVRPYSNNVVIPLITDYASHSSLAEAGRGDEGGEGGEAYDDREGDAEVVHQSPIASQFLLVAKLSQRALILLLLSRGSRLPSLKIWSCHRYGGMEVVSEWRLDFLLSFLFPSGYR